MSRKNEILHTLSSTDRVYILEHIKQEKIELLEKIKKFAYDIYKEFGVFDEVDLEHILDKLKREIKGE